MLYEPPKTKQYIIIGAAAVALAVLALFFWSARKIKPKPVDAPPVSVQKTDAEKQKEMLDAINKAKEIKGQNPLPLEEQVKKQQDITNAINKASENTEPLPPSEQGKKTQDILNAINAASKR